MTNGTRRFTRLMVLVIASSLLAFLGARPAAAGVDVGVEYGEVATWQASTSRFGIEDKLKDGGYWYQCQGVAYWSTNTALLSGTQQLHFRGGCASGIAVIDERPYKAVIDPEGPHCGAIESDPFNVADDGVEFNELFLWKGGHGYQGEGEGFIECGVVTQICFEDQDGSDDFCVDIGLGAPPVYRDQIETGTDPVDETSTDDGGGPCPHGRPSLPLVTVETNPPVPYTYKHTTGFDYIRMVQHFSFTMRGPAGGSWSPQDWWSYLVFQGDMPAIVPPSGDGTAPYYDSAQTPNAVQGTVSGISPFQGNATRRIAYTSGGQGGNGGSVVTWHMFLYVSNSQTVDNQNGNTAGSLAITSNFKGAGLALGRGTTNPAITNTPLSAPPASPGEYVNKAVGWTDTAGCVWYTGEKLVNDEPLYLDYEPPPPPDDEVDRDEPTVFVGPPGDCPEGTEVCIDPVGDIDVTDDDDGPPGDDGQPTEEECAGFSITDPTTWGGSVVCAIVKLIGVLVDGIRKIVNAILGLVEALLDGLASLFIPDGDLLADHIAGLSDMFNDSPAGGWTDAVEGGIGGSPGGGCSGPSFDLPPIQGEDLPTIKPFDACGSTAGAASTVRSVLSVMIALGGGFFMLRMVLTSLGIRTPTPMGGGDSK